MRTILQCRHRFALNSKPLWVCGLRTTACAFIQIHFHSMRSTTSHRVHEMYSFIQLTSPVSRNIQYLVFVFFFSLFARQQFRILPNLNRHALHTTDQFLFLSLYLSIVAVSRLAFQIGLIFSSVLFSSVYKLLWFSAAIFAINDTSYGQSWISLNERNQLEFDPEIIYLHNEANSGQIEIYQPVAKFQYAHQPKKHNT